MEHDLMKHRVVVTGLGLVTPLGNTVEATWAGLMAGRSGAGPTPLGDRGETLAVKKTFGAHSYKLAFSSTKSMTGHLLGAAGGIEAVFTVLAIHRRKLPPTINYNTPDPECDLNYVVNEAREGLVEYALTNGFGFGGTNAALIFKRFEE